MFCHDTLGLWSVFSFRDIYRDAMKQRSNIEKGFNDLSVDCEVSVGANMGRAVTTEFNPILFTFKWIEWLRTYLER